MLGASIILWLVVVYSARVVCLGNGLQRLTRTIDSAQAERLDALTRNETSQATVEDLVFLRRFARLGLLETVMVVLELVVLGVLWWVNVAPVLSLGLFLKNILMLFFSVILAYTRMVNGMFAALLALPRWVDVIERANALVSALGALALLLQINGISIFPG